MNHEPKNKVMYERIYLEGDIYIYIYILYIYTNPARAHVTKNGQFCTLQASKGRNYVYVHSSKPCVVVNTPPLKGNS